MTNYTKTTDFAAKDSLPSGDSGKIIRGSEFETEFDNIATAVNSKSDANNPTFTGTVTIDGLTVNGNTILGNAATDTVTVTADIASNLIPSADDTYNLGAVGAEWNDLFIDGTANIDSLVADTADINGGTVDGVTIGGSSAGAITGTTITGSGLTVGTTNTTSLSGNEINFNRAGTSYLRQAGGGELIVTTNDGVSDKARLKLNTNGDISFYEDTGTTAKFFWDASAELLGIGTSSPATNLEISDSSGAELRLTNSSTALSQGSLIGALEFYSSDTSGINPSVASSVKAVASTGGGAYGELTFNTIPGATEGADATEAMRIDSSGNVGIGTSSPTNNLDIAAASSATLSVRNTSTVSSILLSNGSSANQVFSRGVNSSTGRDLAFVQGTAEVMRIDTSGNVGIGTDSPLQLLHVQSASGSDAALQLRVSDTTSSTDILFGDTGNASAGKIKYGHSNNALSFSTSGTERMLIDFSGNVGIGTDSPAARINTKGNDALLMQTVANDNYGFHVTVAHGTDMAKIGALDSADGSKDGSTITFGDFGRNIQFSTNKGASLSEAMRIDSSGNLLVGKTSTSIPTVGIEARPDGVFAATRAGNTVGFFNRTTSDGAIVDFRKDNTSVGSIGTNLSRIHMSAGASGIFLDGGGTPAIWPWKSTATTSGDADDEITLGDASNRWANLYLSGGVYLGGVAAENKLEDYEEGTWTPVASNAQGFTLGTPTGANGSYTKIGRTVNLKCGFTSLDSTDVIAVGDRFEISGIPFNTSGNYTAATASSGSCFIYNSFGGGTLATGTVTHSGSILIVFIDSVLGSPTFSNDFNIGLVYESA